MKDNSSLHKAKKLKNDEFYTQLSDIQAELQHYSSHFYGRTIYCNCDDPTWSNFWVYFHRNFKALRIARLLSTHYEKDGSPSYALEYKGGNDPDVSEGRLLPLKSTGDFRDAECIGLLKESDIVVTNPPFSLMREYIKQLIDYQKHFIIISNLNTVSYKEVFPLLKEDKIWCGNNHGKMSFMVKCDSASKDNDYIDDKRGISLCSMGNILWLTNLDIPRKHIPLSPKAEFNKELYPRYDNYAAVEVSRVDQIPNYDGIMGVPLSYIYYHNPEEYNLLDINPHFIYTKLEGNHQQLSLKKSHRKDPFARLLIKKI